MAKGRPTKFKPEYVEQARKLSERGMTDMEMADFFDVGITTFERWKVAHDDFRGALKDAKEIADARVEQSLYQKAMGYEVDAVKIFQYEGKAVKVEYREKYAPDTTACIFWLKNRNREKWRDRVDGTTTHDISDPMAALLASIAGPVFPKKDDNDD